MNCKPGATRQGGVAIVFAALLLAFSGLWAGAAIAGPDKQPDRTLNDHPSGKDRTAEPGGKTQGASTSDPDGMANGGADKPGGEGGFDDDKDGNNGCGNDDDFEDDNNGNCGGRRVGSAGARGAQKQSEVKSESKVQSGSRVQSGEVHKLHSITTEDVKSVQGTTTAVHGTAAVQAIEDTRVLGVSLVREQPAAVAGTRATRSAAAPAVLAATGAPAVETVAIACVFIAMGGLLLTAARRETSLA